MGQAETKLNEVIADSSSFDTDLISQVILICSVVVLLLLTGVLLGTMYVRYQKKHREREFEREAPGKLTKEETKRLSEYCISPSEEPLCYLGQDLVEDFLKSEENADDWENGCRGEGFGDYGFSYMTNKRIYFKGQHYYRNHNGHIGTTRQPETYDRKEILGCKEITKRPIWPVVSVVILTVLYIGGLGALLVIKLTGGL